jgi:hypothetical protein
MHIYIYILYNKPKIYIKTLKTLLHVSITRSSSGSIYCSLLKLYFKNNSVIYFVMLTWCCGSMSCVLCVSRTLFRMSLAMAVRRVPGASCAV